MAWSNPSPVKLVAGVTASLSPGTAQGNVRPDRCVLTNSSPFTLNVFSNNRIVYVSAWSVDLVTVDPNNPIVTVTPGIGVPTSTPYDTSLYVTWLDPTDETTSGYPQSITPNVLPSQPPGTGLQGLSANQTIVASGTVTLIQGPGVGNSIFVNTISISGTGSGGTASSSVLVEDGLSNILLPCLFPPNYGGNVTCSFNGFQVGDNRRLQVVTQLASGLTGLVIVAVTYSVGVTQS